MKIPWNSYKTWRKNYKNFRQIICKQQAKPRNIYMWWSRKFIKSKEKIRMMYFAKIEYNRTVSCRGLFHIAFPLIFNGSSVFMKYSICQTHPRKKKSYLTRNVSRVFLQTKLQNLLFDRRTCFQKYINMISNACGQRTQQKKIKVVFICTAWRPKILWKDVYFCNS